MAANLQYVLGKLNEQKLPPSARRKVATKINDLANTQEMWSKRKRPARYSDPAVASAILNRIEKKKPGANRKLYSRKRVAKPSKQNKTEDRVEITNDTDDETRSEQRTDRPAVRSNATHEPIPRPLPLPVQLNFEIDCTYISNGLDILKTMYPHLEGFENTALGSFVEHKSLPRFAGVDPQSRFVQIFHQPGHWVCGTNVFSTSVNEIYWYDSLPKDFVTENALIQLTSFMRHVCANDYFDIQLRKCDRQPDNSVICGFYALANAAAICAGQDPTLWHYDPSRIVEEISNGLRTKSLLPVQPRMKKNIRSNIATITEQKRHCLCYKPSNDTMVMCSVCGNWYNVNCVHITAEQQNRASVNWSGPCCTRRTTDDPFPNKRGSTTSGPTLTGTCLQSGKTNDREKENIETATHVTKITNAKFNFVRIPIRNITESSATQKKPSSVSSKQLQPVCSTPKKISLARGNHCRFTCLLFLRATIQTIEMHTLELFSDRYYYRPFFSARFK